MVEEHLGRHVGARRTHILAGLRRPGVDYVDATLDELMSGPVGEVDVAGQRDEHATGHDRTGPRLRTRQVYEGVAAGAPIPPTVAVNTAVGRHRRPDEGCALRCGTIIMTAVVALRRLLGMGGNQAAWA